MSEIDQQQRGTDVAELPTLQLNRRVILSAAGLTGVALVVSACGGGGSSAGPSTPSPSAVPTVNTSNAGVVLGSTMSIPVGGGVIYANQNVVVTQPTAGKFEGFSATCTHAGCQVALVTQGVIVCPCHSSNFSIKDGSVVSGPAPSPLPPAKIKVAGTDVVLEG